MTETSKVTSSNPNSSFIPLTERKRYNSWRKRILISVILGYAAYYLCRQNFSMVIPVFIAELGYTKFQIGMVLTNASVIYGIGKFVNGYISDKSNARYFMPIGLLCSATVTFLLGFSNSLLFLLILWMINNWFQSMGWPPAARMLTHWFASKELGTKWALGAASHQVGGAIALVFSGYLVTNFGWRSAFFIPGIISAFISLWLFTRLRESPKEVDLPPVELYKCQDNFQEENNEANLTTLEIIQLVFMNKKMWYLCLANMCLYVVRIGVIYWAPLFLKEYKEMPLTKAGWQVAGYEVIGLAGGFTAGWISDKIFNGQRGPVGAIFMIALALSLVLFWLIPGRYEVLSSVALIFIGFCVYGPQVLAGVASADFASKRAIGTANGFVGTFGYIGSALAGICIGSISNNYGWGMSFVFFIVAALSGAVFFYLTWSAAKLKLS